MRVLYGSFHDLQLLPIRSSTTIRVVDHEISNETYAKIGPPYT